MNSRGNYIMTNVLLKVVVRFALSATLYSHETISLMGMYEPKKPKLKKDPNCKQKLEIRR